MLKFDEQTHTYTVDGLKVPSVTQIIRDSGLTGIDASDPAVQAAGQFGTAVHKMTELYDNITLDMGTVAEELYPYLQAWKKFLSETKAKLHESEMRLFHPVHLYAGTFDRTAEINGKNTIIDIKTSQKAPTAGIQTAAYMEMYNYKLTFEKKIRSRMSVFLRPDGSYRIDSHKNKLDFNIFLSALNLYRWKLNNLK
jgi:hypothetical protein|tara:strand:- start:873 stop:1460 length:588 start_codon:yes stop_codon:yes gene_type:complete